MLLGLGVLLALVVAVLAAPVRVAFRVERVTAVEGQVRVRWLYGLARWRIAIPRDTGPKPGRRRKAGARRAARTPRRSGGRVVASLLRQPAFRGRALRLARQVVRAVRPRDLVLRVRIGLDDPAGTGRLWALVGPVAGIAAGLRGADVRIEPEFAGEALEVESRGEVRVVPLALFARVAAFALAPATLRALARARQAAA